MSRRAPEKAAPATEPTRSIPVDTLLRLAREHHANTRDTLEGARRARTAVHLCAKHERNRPLPLAEGFDLAQRALDDAVAKAEEEERVAAWVDTLVQTLAKETAQDGPDVTHLDHAFVREECKRRAREAEADESAGRQIMRLAERLAAPSVPAQADTLAHATGEALEDIARTLKEETHHLSVTREIALRGVELADGLLASEPRETRNDDTPPPPPDPAPTGDPLAFHETLVRNAQARHEAWRQIVDKVRRRLEVTDPRTQIPESRLRDRLEERLRGLEQSLADAEFMQILRERDRASLVVPENNGDEWSSATH